MLHMRRLLNIAMLRKRKKKFNERQQSVYTQHLRLKVYRCRFTQAGYKEVFFCLEKKGVNKDGAFKTDTLCKEFCFNTCLQRVNGQGFMRRIYFIQEPMFVYAIVTLILCR